MLSRRDSFITHRAFCDALAEETARVNAASSIHSLATGNINYQLMGNPLGPVGAMAQHFSSIFKPVSSQDIETCIGGHSLWMGQQASQGSDQPIAKTLQEIHEFGSLNSGSIFSDPLVSTSDNAPASDYHQLNWVFGSNKVSSSNNAEALTSTTSLPLNNIVKENNGPDHMLVSVPSLFSTQHQSYQAPSANMSATALLQQAAQIGAITSTDTSFLDGIKYSGLYGSNTTPPSTTLKTDLKTSGNDVSTLNQLQMYPAAKRRRTQNNHEDMSSTGGQTRDFLGVGVQEKISGEFAYFC